MDFEKVYGKTECRYCGASFVRRSYNHAQCDVCRDRRELEAQQERDAKPVYTKFCPVCGTEFETKMSHKVYCSKDCREQHELRRQMDRDIATMNEFHEALENLRTTRLSTVDVFQGIIYRLYPELPEIDDVAILRTAIAYILKAKGAGYEPKDFTSLDRLVDLAAYTAYDHDIDDVCYYLRSIKFGGYDNFYHTVKQYTDDLDAGKRITLPTEYRFVWWKARDRFQLYRSELWREQETKVGFLRMLLASGLDYQTLVEYVYYSGTFVEYVEKIQATPWADFFLVIEEASDE